MDLETLKQTLKKGINIIFGPTDNQAKGSYEGMPYIEVNTKEKTIMFTSDNSDYKMSKKLEQVLESLFKEFGLTDFNVNIHIHKGENHDKDVTINLHDIEGVQDSNELPEVVKFVQDNFYNVEDWDFVVK